MTAKAQLANVEHLPTTNPTPMDLLQAAVANGVDAEQLEKLMDLQERYQANEARRAFSNAKADFQSRCPTILKTKSAGRGITYAPLDEVLRTIRPHLDATGLSVSFSTRKDDGERVCVCTVMHRDGHSEESTFPMQIDSEMRVNDTQKTGSANSYAKRYALMGALNLVASDDDDDGYAAGTVNVSEEEVARLTNLMKSIKDIDRAAFFKFLGVDKLEDLPAKDFNRALNALKRKKESQ